VTASSGAAQFVSPQERPLDLISIEKTDVGAGQKKRDSQAQRFRDPEIGDKLCLARPEDRRVRQRGFFIPFLWDKIHRVRASDAVDDGGKGGLA
jgi:hypothetical protein